MTRGANATIGLTHVHSTVVPVSMGYRAIRIYITLLHNMFLGEVTAVTSSDEIFFLHNQQVTSLPSRSFRAGHLGATLEESLQKMLSNPDLLPGRQIAPGSDDPPRFQLLCREASVAGGKSLDHVFIDQHGVPTLLEAKLFENQEARRDVIGQILEYAASAADDWGDGNLRKLARNFWRTHNAADIDEVLSRRFDIAAEDVESFWTKLELNLQNNRIRLIVAGDRIRPLVRRVLEFLNAEMKNVEVYALELSCFGNGDMSVVVPTIVGQTQRSADSRERIAATRDGARVWPAEDLRSTYLDLGTKLPVLSERLLAGLNWALGSGVFDDKPTKTKSSSLGVLGPGGNRLFTFYEDGSVNWNVGDKFYAFDGGASVRDDLLKRFISQGMADESYHYTQIKDCKRLSRPIHELTTDEFETLLLAMSDACGITALESD